MVGDTDWDLGDYEHSDYILNFGCNWAEAHQGHIPTAIRIMRAATELGLRTVAVFPKEDQLSLHRFKADEAYQIGEGKGPVEAYLDVDRIVALAKEKGVDAIHPGYGFLSENPALPRACEAAGITFVGPSAELLEMLGDKTAALVGKEHAHRMLVLAVKSPQQLAVCQVPNFQTMLLGGGECLAIGRNRQPHDEAEIRRRWLDRPRTPGGMNLPVEVVPLEAAQVVFDGEIPVPP